MKKITILLLAACLSASYCTAQFSASDDPNGTPYTVLALASTGLDKIFLFKDASNAVLSYATYNPSNWTWYRYEQDPAASTAVSASDVHTTAAETVLENVQTGYGYYVQSSDGTERHYCFVVAYLPASVSDITFTTEGDVCNNLTLKVTASVDNLYYFTTSGLRKVLNREFSLNWYSLEWNSTGKNYAPKAMSSTSSNLNFNWSVTAPLCNTYFILNGDQYASHFGSALSFSSAQYTAVAVKANALAVPQVHEGANEIDKATPGEYSDGSSPAGPAPFVIDFYSYPSEAVQYYEWYVFDSEDGTGPYKRYSDENLNHTFLEAGKSLVKLYVSNSICKDSASFTPTISESKLDCPNFFTPRSTPGENDEFRVAYRSLVKFKGTIINRWGNVLFEWTDPSKGWNGTFKGKAVSPGVYFYLIEAKGSDGIVYKKKGDINLLE